MSDDRSATTGEPESAVGAAASNRTHEASQWSKRVSVRRTVAVARLVVRLSVRRRWTSGLTALFAFFTLILVVFGGSTPGPIRADAIVVSLASLVTYLVPLTALVYGFDTIVGADESGWLEMVFALPVARERVVIGAFLGRAVTLTGATAIGFGLGGVALSFRAGIVSWGLYANVVVGAVALGLSFLALGVLVSTVAANKTHALGVSLLVWVWFVFGHDLAALGAVTAFDLPDVALSALVLANPIDIFRVFVLAGIDAAGSGMAAVAAETGLSRPVLLAGSFMWVVAPVAVATRLIGRRSL